MTHRNPWGDYSFTNSWATEEPGTPPLEQQEIRTELDIWRHSQFSQGGAATETVKDLTLYWHPQQWEALVDCKARFRVIAAGWAWGKSIALAQHIIKECLLKPGVYWWVAPTFALAKIVQREYLDPLIPSEMLVGRYHQTEHFYQFKNGAKLFLKSADNPGGLVGERCTGIVVDEATRCREEAWTNALRGRLTGNDGAWAIFISSPEGHDWFYRLWERGMDPAEREWAAFQFPTWGNPMISPEEIESARRDLPPSWFSQNYGAEFLSRGGGAFPGLDEALRNIVTGGRLPTHYYLTAADLGDAQDFSVIVTYCARTRMPVALKRFRHGGWINVIEQIREQALEYPGQVWVDSTGVGKPIYQQLVAPWKGDRFPGPGLNVREYDISGNEKKKDLIQQYQAAIEMGRIFVPQDGTHGPHYVREHRSFRPTLSRTGKIIWSAPPGWNDDCVLAGAIANFGLLSCPVSSDPRVLYPTGRSVVSGRPIGE